MATASKAVIGVLGVRLADGTEHRFEVTRKPRYWKSWVMDQLPYGTVYMGCTWIKERR